MNNTLLQTPIPQTIWERFGDQAFTIIILGLAVYFLWQRLKEVESKMDKYVDEDRGKMMDVIEKNTKAFERLETKLK